MAILALPIAPMRTTICQRVAAMQRRRLRCISVIKGDLTIRFVSLHSLDGCDIQELNVHSLGCGRRALRCTPPPPVLPLKTEIL